MTFGYSRAEVLGQSVDMLYADPADGRRIHRTVLEAGRCTAEIVNVRKNGTTFLSLLAASTLRNGTGGLLGVMGVSRDITEAKRAEEELRKLDRMKSEFVDSVTHELRTPLHSIRGFVKLLLDGKVPDSETQNEFLGIIDEQGEHLGRLVDDLLEVSRINADHLELAQDRLSLRDLVHKTAQKLSNLARDKEIEFEIDVPSVLPTIKGDEQRLTQVLANL